MPLARRLVQIVLHDRLPRGDAEAADPTLGLLLPPGDLRAYIADHGGLWASTPTAG